MEINWTEEQSRAINNKNVNLLVSAAAGSGKTAVLVERIIDTLLNKDANIDDFLIVTFTNAAARDMKKKIHKSLTKRIKDGNNNNYKIRKQINKLNNSSISTIHSFCSNIIRKYYYLIEVDPNFMVSETEENEILFNEALEEILEEFYVENSDEFQSLVDNYSEYRGDIRLEELIRETYISIQSFSYPIEWLKNSVDRLKTIKKDNIWFGIIRDEITTLLTDADKTLKEMEALIEYEGPGQKYYDAIKGDKEIISELKNSVDSMDILIKEYNSISYTNLASIPKAKQDKVCREFKEKRKVFKSIIEEIGKNLPKTSFDSLIKTTEDTYRPMRGLFKVIQKLDERFKEKKNDKGLLDFNDLEHYALDLLDRKEVSNYYKNKFKYIYIDEYQDSNEVQETIISRIKRKNNLFMVGDVKQSIYRFRQADPKIFMTKQEEYSKQEDINMLVNLNKNFRSRKEILRGINYLFSKIMSEKLGEVDYHKENYLYEGIHFETNELSSDLELNIFNKAKNDDKDDIEDELILLERAEIEAKITAKKIKNLIGSKTYDREKGWRELEYKDIVILMRATKGMQEVYEEVFTNENIPLYADSNEGYFDSIEIKIIINLLKLVDNLKQDVPLLSVMRSIIGGFSVEELVKIRLEYKERPYYESLLKYGKEKEDSLSEKINNFIKNIERWREQNNLFSLNKLIWNILIETDYYYFVGMLPKGEIRQANLRLLVDKANKFERTKMSGLIKFLKYIDNVKSSSKDLGTARVLGEKDNVVRLMSIHKSKGLEFPVVIITGLNKRFNLLNSSRNVVIHSTCRLAPKYYNINNKTTKETLPRLASKIVLKNEDLSEEMRVLYVGMTRAIDKLIMIGTVNDLDKRKEKWKQGKDYFNLYKSRSYLEWIGRCLYHHEDCGLIRKDEDTGILDEVFSSKWNINVYTYDDLKKDEGELTNREMLYNKIIELKNKKDIKIDTIDKFLNWKYPHEKEEVPAKVSVTELNKLKSKKYSDVKYKIPTISEIPTFTNKEEGFTGQEIGTIVHFVLQVIKLKKDMTLEYIEDEINRMVIKKQLTKEEAEVVDFEKIYKFYNSEIGKRMLRSDKINREEPFIIKKKYVDVKNTYSDKSREILVQGIIDSYFYEGKDIVLIDYKTDSLYKKTMENLLHEYRYQIKEYRRALEEITGKKVKESYIYLMSADKFIKVF